MAAKVDITVIKKKHLKEGKLIGEGQYGVVHKGRLALSRDQIVRVAIKKLVDDPEVVTKTSEEAAVMWELQGEAGVPRLYGVTTNSPPSLVMELCPGEPLEDCMRRGEVRACLLALVQVCGVVQRLHARGVTHGDIHEGNVLVDVSNEGDLRAFLLDFGLAKRGTDYRQQESDLIDLVTTALEVIPDTERLSDLRWHLDRASDVDEVMTLLHEALEDDDLPGMRFRDGRG